MSYTQAIASTSVASGRFRPLLTICAAVCLWFSSSGTQYPRYDRVISSLRTTRVAILFIDQYQIETHSCIVLTHFIENYPCIPSHHNYKSCITHPMNCHSNIGLITVFLVTYLENDSTACLYQCSTTLHKKTLNSVSLDVLHREYTYGLHLK